MSIKPDVVLMTAHHVQCGGSIPANVILILHVQSTAYVQYKNSIPLLQGRLYITGAYKPPKGLCAPVHNYYIHVGVIHKETQVSNHLALLL